MKTKIFTPPVLAGLGLLLGAIFLSFSPFVQAQDETNTFTYQGRLLRSDRYLDDVKCDFRFDLYSTPNGGSSLAATQVKRDVLLRDGYFTVDLDFGRQFRGGERYLAIQVRCPPETSYTRLDGRVAINPAPQALYALDAKSLDLNCIDNELPLWDGSAWVCGAWTDPKVIEAEYVKQEGGQLKGDLQANKNRIRNLRAGNVEGDAMVYGQDAGGDVSGAYPNDLTVVRIQGKSIISTNSISEGQTLRWNGGAWQPDNVTHIQGNRVSATPPTEDQILSWNGEEIEWGPAEAKPRGNAEGDLTGSYPNPNVVGIRGKPVSATPPKEDQILSWNGEEIEWGPAEAKPRGTAEGDLTGSYPNPKVGGIQNRSVADITPNPGDALVWNNQQWEPRPAILMKSGSKADVDAMSGVNYLVPDDNGFAFTPNSTTICMVTASASFYSWGSAVADPNPYLLTFKETNGNQRNPDDQPPIYFADLNAEDTNNVPGEQEPEDGTSATATYVWQINAGTGPTKFGCYVKIQQPEWHDDEFINCRVSYICQGIAD